MNALMKQCSIYCESRGITEYGKSELTTSPSKCPDIEDMCNSEGQETRDEAFHFPHHKHVPHQGHQESEQDVLTVVWEALTGVDLRINPWENETIKI